MTHLDPSDVGGLSKPTRIWLEDLPRDDGKFDVLSI